MKTPRPETRNQVRLARFFRRMQFDNEATQVAELRPDGVPLGIGSGKTMFLPRPPLDAATPRFVVTTMWVFLAFFSLYGASDVRAFVAHDETLSSMPTLVSAVDTLEAVGRTLGPAKLRSGIDSLLSPMKSKTDDEEWLEAKAEEVAPLKEAKHSSSTAPEKTRVLLIGASSMEFYLGSELERRLETYRSIQVHRFGKLGTGLARPDQFDWPKQVRKLLKAFKPHMVIAQFGGNDGQNMTSSSRKTLLFGTPAWEKEYVARVSRVVKMVTDSGAQMVMLGMPITRHRKHSEKLRKVNDITRRASLALGGSFIPTWDISVDEKGKARDSVKFADKTGPMYLTDGIHFARVGAAMVAHRLAFRLERLLAFVPSNPKYAAVYPFEMESSVRGKKVSYLAFVPQPLVPNEKVPALLLLHGASASPVDFSENAHELLQKLAGENRIIVVAPDCDGEGWYLDSPKIATSQIETFLMKEFLPHLREKLPVSGRLGVAGISMGGNGALTLAMKYPKAFLSVSSMSGAVDLSQATERVALVDRLGPWAENTKAWEGHSAFHLVQQGKLRKASIPIFLTVGEDDKWLSANQALSEALKLSGVAHQIQTSSGGHTWSHWVSVLPSHIAWHANILRPDLKTLPEVE